MISRPASATQLEMWLAVQGEPESGRYNASIDLEFDTSPDVPALRAALADVLTRHPELRSSFQLDGGELHQVVRPDLPVSLADLPRPGSYSRDAALAWARAEGDRPFDLASPPLLRAGLLRCADGALLVLTVHHIVTDTWSMELLADHLLQAYQARLEGVPTALPAPSTVDAEDTAAEDLAYWADLTADGWTALAVPTDLVRPESGVGEGGTLVSELSPAALTGLRELAETERVSPATVLLAGWGLLLSAWSGEPDGVLGMPFSGRSDPRLDHEIGLHTRVLPVRVRLGEQDTFRQLLGTVREQVLDGLEHERVPLDQLRTALARHGAEAGVYRAVFDHRSAEPVSWTVAGAPVRLLDHEVEGVKYDLGLAGIERPDSLRLRVDYDTAVYREATVRLVLDQLTALLTAAVADPGQDCRDLLGTLADPARASEAVEGTTALLPELVLGHAKTRPDALAVRHGEQTLTYGELSHRAGTLANWLRERGAGPERIVALMLPPGVDTVVAMLAVALSGAAYLPLDPAYPAHQRTLVLADAAPVLVLCAPEQAEEVGGFALDAALAQAAALPGTPPVAEIRPESTLNVLYTSGSTGRPKGVVLPHIGLARLMGEDRFLRLEHTDVIANLCPLNFDGASYEIWGALAHGAALLVLDKDIVLSPVELRTQVRAHGVTTLVITTPLLNRIIEDTPDLLQSLRRVYFGGERISVPHVRRALRWCAPGTLVHSYGPTENSFTSTYWPIETVRESDRTVPIGVPVPETELHVVFEGTTSPAPAGVIGELLLGGPGVAHGYLNDPERTAKVFVPNPFGPGTLYRTGDRVRWTAEGLLEFVSRADNQVKIRSQRVELGEVEAALLAHDLVEACFVTTAQNQRDEREIVAYVVYSGQSDVDTLRAHLRRVLPSFAVPTHLVELSELPLNRNGKIDRPKLPKPTAAGPVGPTGRTSLANGAYEFGQLDGRAEPALEQVLGAWREVLGVAEVAARDSFFDVGGHSLLVVKLQEALRSRTGVTVSIAQLMGNPSAADQAELLSGAAPVTALPVVLRGADAAEDIAVIGMAGRFAGARDVEEYWANLRAGRDCLTTGRAPVEHADGSRTVYRYGLLADGLAYDGSLFGIGADEPRPVDPQHAVFYECLWAAVEDAGLRMSDLRGRTSLYGGRAVPGVKPDSDGFLPAGEVVFTEATFMNTWFSYHHDLGGESMLVDSGCSTALVAVHLAAESLRRGDCDYALAGGVSIQANAEGSYVWEPGQVFAEDGVSRPFDQRSTGVVAGDGAGAVLLRRLSDARRDGDPIHAVIKGSAINNDGLRKVGYTAPGVDGQAKVLARALARAGVPAAEVDYVETHGTGTRLGDAVELGALAQVYGAGGPLALGSVKAAIGHTDTAAGIAGLIKAALAVREGFLPATPNVAEPVADLAEQFELLPAGRAWTRAEGPRTAGVSSFGLGGTNAHLIIQEHREEDR
ncbi:MULTISPECIES: amino acid adenylation domain-containing protein [unclassified Crossiella]|uniref:non-ribosomal peptide synthetase n=1 Tax=unclassified Crossiella TaxID=2620835 RepID=UPI001FFEAEAF|nr:MULTISPECIES: amino acid adenylation domain-containing protein [unclassified Crossiella]MCK2244141.1 amino acid adenylation domain-containing protein [Crossiella sp. S99.2]MCK2257945.1 amino acid adenylation domain-containing protein [Crossiella sp. S99.1]